LSKTPADEDLAKAWDFPSFVETESVDVALGSVRVPTAGDLEKIQQQAIDEASKQGYEDGFAKGLKESERRIAEKINSLESVMQSLAEPFLKFDERVESEIASLAIQISKQLIRRELKADSGQVVGVVREALAALPSSSQNIQLFLHPEDAVLVKSALSLDESEETRWKVVEDVVITRGGCRVATNVSTIDVTIENRLATIIAKALGDERISS